MVEQSINEHVNLLGLATVISLFAVFLAVRFDFFRMPIDTKVPGQDSPSGWQVIVTFAIYLGISLIVLPSIAFLFMAFTGHKFTEPLNFVVQGWLNSLGMVLTAFSLCAYYFLLPQMVRKTMIGKNAFISVNNVLNDLRLGVYTWFVSFPVVLFIGQIITIIVLSLVKVLHVDQVAVDYLKKTMAYPYLYFTTVFLLVFIVPFIEELIFRGVLQNWLKSRLGLLLAIIITSILFAGCHFSISQGWENFELLSSLFILSCFLGFIYERQQSLIANVTLHFTFNAISVITLSFQ